MAIQTTSDLPTRLALPLELLQEALRERDVTTGCLADLEPFTQCLDSSVLLAEAVALVLQKATKPDGVSLNRMEMLNLLCIAVSGSDVENAGPAMRRCLHRLLVFVNGVLLSVPKPAVQPQGQEFQTGDRPDPRPQEADVELNTPDSFYVIEKFEFKPLPGREAAAAATVAEPEPPRAAVCTPDLKAGARCADPIWQRTPGQDVTKNTSAVPLSFSGAEPENAFAHVTRGTQAERVVLVMEDIDVVDELDAIDTDDAADPAAKRPGLLSQPALVACALVLGFGGGMLVPRFTAGGPKPLAASEAANAGTLRLPATSGFMAQPLSDRPRWMNTPGTYEPAALPQAERMLSEPPAQACLQAGSVPQNIAESAGYGDNSGSISSTAFVRPRSHTPNSVPPNVALANALYCPHPDYPAPAKLTQVEGEVVLAIVIAADGSVPATRVLEGQPLLRGAAEAAVRHWRFRPFLEDGSPVPKQTLVVVDVRPPL